MTSFNPNFYCAITCELMEDPVIDREGNTYERSAIEEWVRLHGTSPITRSRMSIADLTPNRSLRNAIESEKATGVLPQKNPDAISMDLSAGANMVLDSFVDAPTVSVTISSWHPVGSSVESQIGEEYIVVASVLAQEVAPIRVPSDVVLVVDVSGSMGSEAKIQNAEASGLQLQLLDIVKHAVKTVIQTLGPSDRLSLISFSNSAILVFDLIPMTGPGKGIAMDLVNRLTADGMTNLWDGLHMALEILKGRSTAGETAGRNAAILLLTDGEPNIEPPRGHIPMLKRYLTGNGGRYPGAISTFGFGYSLDSVLLRNLAVEGGGMYAFIPDSGFVGTAFVNALGNVLSTVTADAALQVTPAPGVSITAVGVAQQTKKAGGLSIPLGGLQIGQARDIVFRVSAPAGFTGPFITSSLAYRASGSAADGAVLECTGVEHPALAVAVTVGGGGGGCGGEAAGGATAEGCEAVAHEVALQMFRAKFVNTIAKAMEEMKRGRQEQAQAANDALRDEIVAWLSDHTDPGHDEEGKASSYQRICDLLEDVTGQVKQALERKEWYDKWGKHYLPSLQRAHELQQCNNFKDPGMQHYGGASFRAVRDEADDIFCQLPPPVRGATAAPVRRDAGAARIAGPRGGGGGSGSGSGGGGYVSRAPAASSMAMYNDRSAGCFHGDCIVALEDGSTKRMRDLARGDRLHGGGAVSCLVEFICEDAKANLVTFSGGLRITPWHPIRHSSPSFGAGATATPRWVFPAELGDCSDQDVQSVFNVVLHRDKDMQMATNLEISPAPSQSLSLSIPQIRHDHPQSLHGEALLVNDVWCVALGHGIQDDRVATHAYFGSEKIVSDLSQAAGWASGCVRFKPHCFVRDRETCLVAGLNLELEDRNI